jgi:hypothetical protein
MPEYENQVPSSGGKSLNNVLNQNSAKSPPQPLKSPLNLKQWALTPALIPKGQQRFSFNNYIQFE